MCHFATQWWPRYWETPWAATAELSWLLIYLWGWRMRMSLCLRRGLQSVARNLLTKCGATLTWTSISLSRSYSRRMKFWKPRSCIRPASSSNRTSCWRCRCRLAQSCRRQRASNCRRAHCSQSISDSWIGIFRVMKCSIVRVLLRSSSGSITLKLRYVT